MKFVRLLAVLSLVPCAFMVAAEAVVPQAVPPTSVDGKTPSINKPSAPHPARFVEVPFVNGRPDPNFILPSGLTFAKNSEIERMISEEFAASEEAKRALQEIQRIMETTERLVVEKMAAKHPEDRVALAKYLDYRKTQRLHNASSGAPQPARVAK